jgi:predicted DNA-binding transcriptional regulator YafY
MWEKFCEESMTRHLKRLLDIDERLRSRKRYTASILAEELEVSERTIFNDIEEMRKDYDAPITSDLNRGYYYENPDWRLPTISLSKGELFALVLGARMLEKYSGTAYVEELKSAIDRLTERLPEATWVDLQQIADERIIFRGGGGLDLQPEIWQGLETACREQRSVQMTYFTASRNATSDRQLDPYLLHIYRGTNPYVIGFCQKRQEIRWFRVDRIKQLAVLPDRFVRNPQFDAQKHLEQIFQVEAGREAIEVAIWFDAPTAPYIRERTWNPTQQIEEHGDGAITLRMTIRSLAELKRWVLGYGKGAKVLTPEELVAIVSTELAGMADHYI